jgi:hypothetical protein
LGLGREGELEVSGVKFVVSGLAGFEVEIASAIYHKDLFKPSSLLSFFMPGCE